MNREKLTEIYRQYDLEKDDIFMLKFGKIERPIITRSGIEKIQAKLDIQVNYKIESLKTIVKVGGNNIGIGSGDYRTRPGGPFVGKLWYMTLTFDEFLN